MPNQTSPRPSETEVTTEESDRRATVRYPCNLKSNCGLPEADADARWPAEVEDLSTTGIRLVVHSRFEPRSALVIELPGIEPGSLMGILAKVVHVKARGPDSWQVGCVFRRLLSHDEVEAVLHRDAEDIR
jgi:hypothetical protein